MHRKVKNHWVREKQPLTCSTHSWERQQAESCIALERRAPALSGLSIGNGFPRLRDDDWARVSREFSGVGEINGTDTL